MLVILSYEKWVNRKSIANLLTRHVIKYLLLSIIYCMVDKVVFFYRELNSNFKVLTNKDEFLKHIILQIIISILTELVGINISLVETLSKNFQQQRWFVIAGSSKVVLQAIMPQLFVILCQLNFVKSRLAYYLSRKY